VDLRTGVMSPELIFDCESQTNDELIDILF
jgi:hypothetical protein